MFNKNTLTDNQGRSLVVVAGTEKDFGIEMMAGTSGNLQRGVITVSFLRFRNTQQQLRTLLNDGELWQLLAKKAICGANDPIVPTPFEKLLIEDHEHDEGPLSASIDSAPPSVPPLSGDGNPLGEYQEDNEDE